MKDKKFFYQVFIVLYQIMIFLLLASIVYLFILKPLFQAFVAYPLVTTLCIVTTLISACTAILLNRVRPETPLWISIILYLIGLPGWILLKLTKLDKAVKKFPFYFQILRLPICDAADAGSISDGEANSAGDIQEWIETRSAFQVVDRYGLNSAVREENALAIVPDQKWQSGYFVFTTKLWRIGKLKFLDSSSCSINPKSAEVSE